MRCKLLRSKIPASVSLSVRQLHCANTAERIEVLLRVDTLGDPRNIVLDGSPDFPTDSMRPSPNYFGHLFSMQLEEMFI